MEKKQRLEELKCEIYNSEDVIDGVFNPKEYPELIEINEDYNRLLRDMNSLMKLIDEELNKP